MRDMNGIHKAVTPHQREFLEYVRSESSSDTNYMNLHTVDEIISRGMYAKRHEDMLNNIGKHWENRWMKYQLNKTK